MIREIRLERNYSQYEIAYLLGLNMRQLTAREKGHVAWSVDELEKLAKLFHISVGNLYYLINNGETVERTDNLVNN